jgi:hypothetical protein
MLIDAATHSAVAEHVYVSQDTSGTEVRNALASGRYVA